MKKKERGDNPPLKTWLILPDLHVPYHDEKSLVAVERFMQSRKWDGWLCLGDFVDLDLISHHNLTNYREKEGQRILQQYKRADEILLRHERIIRGRNPQARMIWCEGNHEYRIERLIDEHPVLEGMIEPEIVLRLKERNIEYIKSWSEGKTLRGLANASSRMDCIAMTPMPRSMFSILVLLSSTDTRTMFKFILPMHTGSMMRKLERRWAVFACRRNICGEHQHDGCKQSRFSPTTSALAIFGLKFSESTITN
jgi:hypothetical protein